MPTDNSPHPEKQIPIRLRPIEPAVELCYGGTFDPIHIGHLKLIETLQQMFPGFGLRIIPCAIPPLKNAPTTHFEHRVKMIEACTNHLSNIIIDSREGALAGPSYTVRTLKSIKSEFHNHLVFVMGADSVATLEQWHQFTLLKELCHLCVFNRDGSQESDLNTQLSYVGFKPVSTLAEFAQSVKACESGMVYLKNIKEMPQSSSKIRETINIGGCLDSMLTPSVIKYIKSNQLYQMP